MRIWTNWSREEKKLFERFHCHRPSTLSMEELSMLKAIVDIDLFCQPLSPMQIVEAHLIMDAAEMGILTREVY